MVAEPLDHGPAVLKRLRGQALDGPFHATAGDRPDRDALTVDGKRGPCPTADADDAGQDELPPLLQPLVQLLGHVEHLDLRGQDAGRWFNAPPKVARPLCPWDSRCTWYWLSFCRPGHWLPSCHGPSLNA